MSNFKTTADLLDGVLRRSGEMTSSQGTSPLQSDALLYLDQIHKAIICGGTELETDIDESWVWARHRRPTSFKIQAPYTTTVSLAGNGSITGTIGADPGYSLNGWYMQLQNVPSLYRVISDTNALSISFDQPYVATSAYSGSATFFKLEYDIFPDAFVVDLDNYGIEWGTTGTAGTKSYVDYLTYTSYDSPSSLLSGVLTLMGLDELNNVTYLNSSYSADSRLFTLTKTQTGTTSTTFTLTGNGTTAKNSMWNQLGFDCLTYSGSASYTSAYPLWATARLASPGRVYSQQGPVEVDNIDGISFERRYPLPKVQQGVPTAFTVTYDRGGFMKIRFNKYPKDALRFEIETIPYPRALQNNSASVPLVPQKFNQILEYGAAYYLLLDKASDKAAQYLRLAQEMLKAMMKTNRQDLEKTGRNFGSVVARPDLTDAQYHRVNNYGYSYGSDDL